ncbi:MAG TPA: DUF6644 family protein [Vicinamibacterales bacterium]|nr:DUF6644 family protein [Vicinamibacterales bacterium]
MDLLPLFQWCEESGVGRTIRESVWAFAVIESVHLLALATMGGAVLLVDMRALNLGLRQRSISELAGEVRPFMNAALGVLIVSGLALFSSEAVKCYYSAPFRVKMVALVAAIAFTYTIRRDAVSKAGNGGGGTLALVSLVSVALWFTVAAAGRWIGFSG